MHALSIVVLILTLAGQLWFAWEVWQREDLIWAVLLGLVPFPLLGLYVWYRAGWESCYRNPAIVYFSGYAATFLLRV